MEDVEVAAIRFVLKNHQRRLVRAMERARRDLDEWIVKVNRGDAVLAGAGPIEQLVGDVAAYDALHEVIRSIESARKDRDAT